MSHQASRRSFALTALAGILGAALLGCSSPRRKGPEGARGTQLTSDEVRDVFIGKPWKGSSGIFFFRPNGTYVYTSTKTTTQWGPWRYRINEDGSIAGASATYTFYRLGPAFRYHNSETNEFYLAFPDTSQ